MQSVGCAGNLLSHANQLCDLAQQHINTTCWEQSSSFKFLVHVLLDTIDGWNGVDDNIVSRSALLWKLPPAFCKHAWFGVSLPHVYSIAPIAVGLTVTARLHLACLQKHPECSAVSIDICLQFWRQLALFFCMQHVGPTAEPRFSRFDLQIANLHDAANTVRNLGL